MIHRVLIAEFVSGGGLGDLRGGPAGRPIRDVDAVARGSVSDQSPFDCLLREGIAMRDALVEDVGLFADVFVVDPGRPTAIGKHTAAPASGPGESLGDGLGKDLGEGLGRRWLAQYHRLRCDAMIVVAPEIDGHLGQLIRDLRIGGATVLAPPNHVVEMASDKWLTAQWLERNNLPHPTTSLRLPNRRHDSDWISKPRDGCGSMNIRRWTANETDHDGGIGNNAGSADGNNLYQAYVDGQHVSVSIIGNGKHHHVLHPVTQRIDPVTFAYRGGGMMCGATISGQNKIDRARGLAQRVASAIGPFCGWIGVDMVLGSGSRGDDDANDDVIEINPRLTTSYVGLRRDCDVNLFRWMIDPESDPSAIDDIVWRGRANWSVELGV